MVVVIPYKEGTEHCLPSINGGVEEKLVEHLRHGYHTEKVVHGGIGGTSVPVDTERGYQGHSDSVLVNGVEGGVGEEKGERW